MNEVAIKQVPPASKAKVYVPGSKSYTNRALLIAAMTPKPVKIVNPLLCDDTEAMLSCLSKLGIKIIRGVDYIEVAGDISQIKNRNYDLDTDLSGTTMRFVLALATVVPGMQIIRGGPGLHKRPIGDMVDALVFLGARIKYLEKEGYPPLLVSSSKIVGNKVRVKGENSSQYISALLMIAPLIGELTLNTVGEVISKPYIDMTIATMDQFGVRVSRKKYKQFIITDHQTYNARLFEVEGDVSSASYFFAIAALTQSTITVGNMNPKSIQADMGFLNILKLLGNKISYGKNEISVRGTGVSSLTINMEQCPDQAPTLAVLAAFAPGITTIKGIQSLRIKETERIAALEKELAKMGILTKSTHGSLKIYGGKPHNSRVSSYGDHRMAMSFAVAGTKLPGMVIKDSEVVSKTFPEFWNRLATLSKSIQTNKRNIVLIGMRGSGKTTIAGLLAKHLKREVLDIDSMISSREDSDLPTLISNRGWNYFRDQESEVVRQISSMHNKIISTGGGVVIRPQNIHLLKQRGYIIWLNASVDTLLERLSDKPKRPPLTNHSSQRAEVKHLLNERRELYSSAANTIINTDTLHPEQLAVIIEKLAKDNAL